jgi:hypothetical protein
MHDFMQDIQGSFPLHCAVREAVLQFDLSGGSHVGWAPEQLCMNE